MIEIFTSVVKVSNLTEMFVLTYSLINEKYGPTWNRSLKYVDAMKMDYVCIINFQLFTQWIDSNKIRYPNIKWINKTVLWRRTSYLKFCISITNEPIWIQFADTIVKLKLLCWCLLIWSIFIKHKACFQVLNIWKTKICYILIKSLSNLNNFVEDIFLILRWY